MSASRMPESPQSTPVGRRSRRQTYAGVSAFGERFRLRSANSGRSAAICCAVTGTWRGDNGIADAVGDAPPIRSFHGKPSSHRRAPVAESVPAHARSAHQVFVNLKHHAERTLHRLPVYDDADDDERAQPANRLNDLAQSSSLLAKCPDAAFGIRGADKGPATAKVPVADRDESCSCLIPPPSRFGTEPDPNWN